jgi:hypothetical protein
MSRSLLAVVGILLIAVTGRADDYTVATADKAPDGVSDAVAAVLAGQATELTGPQRVYATLWLAKSLPITADFQATAAVKYPFTPGELIGAVVIPKRSGFTDFRGNELEAGTYTLRYGRQPTDGNHIGTSDLADFLVAIPADKDEDPAVISDLQKLVELSAAASGTTHPAILSLQPAAERADQPTLVHDEERKFWILQLNGTVRRGEKSEPFPLRMVVVGVSEG